jgi:hypothetical protein
MEEEWEDRVPAAEVVRGVEVDRWEEVQELGGVLLVKVREELL